MLRRIIRIGLTLLISAGVHGQTTEKYTISTFAGGMKSLSEEKQGGPAEYAYFGPILVGSHTAINDIEGCVPDWRKDGLRTLVVAECT